MSSLTHVWFSFSLFPYYSRYPPSFSLSLSHSTHSLPHPSLSPRLHRNCLSSSRVTARALALCAPHQLNQRVSPAPVSHSTLCLRPALLRSELLYARTQTRASHPACGPVSITMCSFTSTHYAPPCHEPSMHINTCDASSSMPPSPPVPSRARVLGFHQCF